MAQDSAAAPFPDIRVPVAATFAALVLGLAAGILLRSTDMASAVETVAGPVGRLWLRALQMTILPLVAGLLFTGIMQATAAARAGAMARRTLALFALILVGGGLMTTLAMPLLLDLAPIPQRAARALAAGASDPGPVPGFGDFLDALVPQNVFGAAAAGATLPVVVFIALLALAAARLPQTQRGQLALLFEALAGAMMVVIGWVLALAPLGVFALALGLALRSGSDAIGALAHYIVIVSTMGAVVLVAAYLLALAVARLGLAAFARAVLPAQAVAISTQSSLASLPAMLSACCTLGLREASADFVLPLAVALFRATSPAMNMAVAIYAAKLTGVPITPVMLASGLLVASITTLGTVSLPGTLSFVASIGPIALAMGVPIEPLALLVAVEMLPDVMRTLANVTMNVAVTAVVDRRTG